MAKEVCFEWTCPECGVRQTDSVNAIQGPFLSLTCELCEKSFEEGMLHPMDANAWLKSLDEAERIDGIH